MAPGEKGSERSSMKERSPNQSGGMSENQVWLQAARRMNQLGMPSLPTRVYDQKAQAIVGREQGKVWKTENGSNPEAPYAY